MVKSQFVSMVAHELKTPVAAVQGFLKIIMDESLNVSYEQQKEYISRSIIRLKGLLDLVNDLLDISRMEMKTKQREIEKLDLVELINSTLQFLEIDLAKKGIEVVKKYQEEKIIFNGDQNEITRLFTNILSNAIKYNKDKGTITVNVYYTTNYINVEISDTGIGMKPEERAKLFQEFFRAKNEFTRGVSGTGLGLTIVRRIVDSYHGKIEVESEYGKGTTFKIQLPINN
jgi:signal transduction histidine kinase